MVEGRGERRRIQDRPARLCRASRAEAKGFLRRKCPETAKDWGVGGTRLQGRRRLGLQGEYRWEGLWSRER